MSTTKEAPRFRVRPGTEERARLERWSAKGTARVTHPERGTVVVPCSSNLTAIMNAAEVWRCDWMELRGAEVRAAEPGDVAAVGPPQAALALKAPQSGASRKMPYIKEENA